MIETNKSIADHWYPKDITARALVDEYLEWQHVGARMPCAMYFQIKWLFPLIGVDPPSESMTTFVTEQMEKSLDTFENTWLANPDKSFLASKEISFADILAACELEQPRLANYDPFAGRPRLAAWYEKVKQKTNPAYDEAHAVLNKIIKASKSKL